MNVADSRSAACSRARTTCGVSCRDLRPLNDTAYTVNGIRSTGNTISLNGSNLVEAACNGLMTGVNFGTINVKRGHRVVEFVPTYSF